MAQNETFELGHCLFTECSVRPRYKLLVNKTFLVFEPSQFLTVALESKVEVW